MDDDVGYGKPPRATRFKPGQSGNPRGRPKGIRSFRIELEEELGQLTSMQDGERQITVSKQRALAKTLVAIAMKGDTRAINMILSVSTDGSAGEEGAEAPEDKLIMRAVGKSGSHHDNSPATGKKTSE